ncbi:MAG: N-acetyltransferase DgcN [Rhodospirillaceae bacterium]
MALKTPYLMFLGDAPDQLAAKTAGGVVHWRPDICIGQLRLPGCNADLGLQDMDLEAAAKAGAKTVIVGVANRGGVIGPSWIEQLVRACELGFDIASGLHAKLTDVPAIAEAAAKFGRTLTDARHPTRAFDVANGKKRPGKRLLPVGTDCSVGKMYTALALEREMQGRCMKATFRATGQTGIFIAGSGVSVDAVVADFISGATEWLAPANDPDHWDLVEGQGSLFHASYAGVSLGLLHGAQPDALVLCHEPTRKHMRGLPDFPLPGLKECIAANEQAARLTNPAAKCIGVSVDTHNMPAGEGLKYLAKVEVELGLPAVDPVVTGVARLVDNLP